jgi:adenylate kinase
VLDGMADVDDVTAAIEAVLEKDAGSSASAARI